MSEAIETKKRILSVAFRLFHEQGYNATSISTILREAEVNSGSLYHFFPGKEALLSGVLGFALGELHPRVMANVQSVPDPIERIFALLAWYRNGMQVMSCRMGCPIGNLALEVADDLPEARQLIDQNFANWTGFIQRWLQEAGNRLPAELDRQQLARFVLTVMEGGIMQSRAAGNLGPFDDSVAQFRAYIELLISRAATHSG